MAENDTETGKPDIPAIMQEIRERVTTELESHRDKRPPLRKYAADSEGGASRKAGELVHSEELRFLNHHHAYSLTTLNPDAIKSHRPGWTGKLIVKAKRKILSLLWDGLLKDYLSAEKEFNANLVRYLNDVSKYVDARDASNFWELIRKIDVDITRAMERIERISDETNATIHSSEDRLRQPIDNALRTLEGSIATLATRVDEDRQRTLAIDSAVAGMEGIIGRIGSRALEGGVASSSGEIPDYRYVLLENRFRGSEEDIVRRMQVYPPLFRGVAGKVLEIGPGRGELQRLFMEQNIPAYGVDSDAAMVEEASARNLDVRLGDGIAHLRECPDDSLGGVIAIQVVEHLPPQVLEDLIKLCQRKVRKGGRVVFETIDPRSLLALSSNYFRDPTHVAPLHPDTLSFAMTTEGLKVLEIKRLSPVPQNAQLQEIQAEEYMTPRWVLMIERLNADIRQLNDLLYGYQDYCVIAEKC